MADDVAELNPSLIMAASLIYMSSIDGTIAQQEWGQLKTVVGWVMTICWKRDLTTSETRR
ncbi:MAG: hypothetical protein CM15mP58_16130 [Burkholderiaceae bacterium]|nr:MAG: hypothetical protein CM15mP58_16130 [Burkholderiaceae bacterium]